MSPSVLWVCEAGRNGMAHYRAHTPCLGWRQAGHLGWVRHVLSQRDDGLLVGLGREHLAQAFGGPAVDEPEIPDVVISRHTRGIDGGEMPAAEMFRRARDAGQQVWVDLDDDVWGLPPGHPGRVSWTPADLAVLEANIAAADGVLCSSASLADEVASHVPTSRPVVFPPTVSLDRQWWPEPAPPRPKVRIGWLGLMRWRASDLAWIAPRLAQVAKRHPDCELWHLGFEDRPGRPRVAELNIGWPVVERPWVDPVDLGHGLEQVDVVLFALDCTQAVNRSRSITLGLAAAAASRPCVAEEMNADYLAFHHQGGCRSFAELEDLIADPAHRRQAGAAARRTVERAHTPAHAARRLNNLIRAPLGV